MTNQLKTIRKQLKNHQQIHAATTTIKKTIENEKTKQLQTITTETIKNAMEHLKTR